MTKIDRRIIKTRQAISDAVLELMQEKDFTKITIREISDRANIGNRTFYLHYLDKYDVIEKMMQEHIDECAHLCDTVDNPLDSVKVCFAYLDENRTFFKIMLSDQTIFSFQKYFIALIKKLCHKIPLDKVYTDKTELELAYQFIAYGVYGIAEEFIKDKNIASIDAIAKQINTLTLQYLKR